MRNQKKHTNNKQNWKNIKTTNMDIHMTIKQIFIHPKDKQQIFKHPNDNITNV